ncbi:MAG: cobalamin-dependent protein, partial [Clostridia bacterium]|nr:cobalamin-dependent protein [Clostridia bacterium]
GDIHDIGKNIVGVMLRSYGFEVIDLGKNVPPAAVCAACTPDVKLVGLSALMTTTVPSMARTIAMLRKRAPWVRVIVGGAVLTAGYAKTIGADAYSPDAVGTVRYAESIYSGNDPSDEEVIRPEGDKVTNDKEREIIPAMKTIAVPDMMCARCAARIEKALAAKNITATVDKETKTVGVSDADAPAAIEAIREAGYSPEYEKAGK